MKSLHAYNNHFGGQIPTELGMATSLEEVILANNTIDGTIPSELGQLSSAYMMFLSYNPGLGGSLPKDLELLSSSIQAFDISSTNITGDIPSFLQEAQNDTSFARYYFHCNRNFPCPEDKPESDNALYDQEPND